jgi:hypothetical protein
VADEIVVDLMGAACGVTYDQAMAQDVEYRDVDGARIPLAGKRLLIRLKDTVRTSDLVGDSATMKLGNSGSARRRWSSSSACRALAWLGICAIQQRIHGARIYENSRHRSTSPPAMC